MAKSQCISNLEAPVCHRRTARCIDVAAVATEREIVLTSVSAVFLGTHSVKSADEFVYIDHGCIEVGNVLEELFVFVLWWWMELWLPRSHTIKAVFFHGHQ